MPKNKGNPKATGKYVQNEKSIVSKLNEMVTTLVKVYYIVWKYASHLLPDKNIKTFKDLTDHYAGFTPTMTEEFCESWLFEEGVQEAVTYLLKRLHQQKLVALYNQFYEKALGGDVQAFKAFTEFSDKFFADKGENELYALLKNTDIPDED